MMAAYAVSRARQRPSVPLSAMSTSKPSARSPIASASAMLASSSTTSTRIRRCCHGARMRLRRD